MVEECDNLGGVQVLFDSEGFFGGIASEIVRDFKDDISHNIPILTYCLSSSPVGLMRRYTLKLLIINYTRNLQELIDSMKLLVFQKWPLFHH